MVWVVSRKNPDDVGRMFCAFGGPTNGYFGKEGKRTRIFEKIPRFVWFGKNW